MEINYQGMSKVSLVPLLHGSASELCSYFLYLGSVLWHCRRGCSKPGTQHHCPEDHNNE